MKTARLFLFFLPLSIFANPIFAQEENSFGYLKLEFNADSALIVIDYDFTKDTLIANGDSLELEVGSHTIELNRPLTKKITCSFFIKENATLNLEVNFSKDTLSIESVKRNYASKKYFDSNIFILTDLDSEILYKSELIGTGFASISAPYETDFITIKNPDFGSKNILINGLPFLEVHEHYERPSRSRSRILSIAPGASQFYKKDYLKSILTLGTFYPLLFKSLDSKKRYDLELDELDLLMKSYSNAIIEEDARILGDLVEKKLTTIDELKKRKNRFFFVTGLVYTLNILDGWINKPKGGFKEKHALDFYIDTANLSGNLHANITMQINLK